MSYPNGSEAKSIKQPPDAWELWRQVAAEWNVSYSALAEAVARHVLTDPEAVQGIGPKAERIMARNLRRSPAVAGP